MNLFNKNQFEILKNVNFVEIYLSKYTASFCSLFLLLEFFHHFVIWNFTVLEKLRGISIILFTLFCFLWSSSKSTEAEESFLRMFLLHHSFLLNFFKVVLDFHFILVLHHIIHATRILNVLLLLNLLLFGVSIISHFSTPVFGVCLSFSSVSLFGHICTLLDGVLTQDIIIGLLFNFSSVIWYALKLSDNPDTFASI